MGLWTLSGAITALSRHRIPALVMDATVMSDGEETEAVALPPSIDGRGLDVSFDIKFASNPPGTVDYQLQIANENIDADFENTGSSMTNTEAIGGIIVVQNVVARFARVEAVDADSVAVTVNIMCQ